MSTSTLPQTPGVYIILNTVNHHMYVGSTNNLRNRYVQHSNDFRRGNHRNQHLQRAYNRYGPDAFAFIVVDHLPDTSNLIEREQLFIDLINPEYNIAPFANRLDGLPPDIIAAKEAKRIATREAMLLKNPNAFRKTPEGIARSTEAARVVNLGSKYSSDRVAKREETKRLKREADPLYDSKISSAKKGKKLSPQSIAKREETKAARRLENPNAYKPNSTPEHVANMTEAARIANTGNKKSPEEIARREATKRANRLAQQQAQDVQQEKLF